jgi:hypothetical protein
MTLDEAIKEVTSIIKSASGSAEIKTVKMSEEEARLSVYAPAKDIERIKVATFQPAINFERRGSGCSGFVYDKGAPP